MKRKIFLLFAIGMMTIAPPLSAQKVDISRNLINSYIVGETMTFEFEVVKDSNFNCTNYRNSTGKCSFERIRMPMERISVDFSKAPRINLNQAEKLVRNPDKPIEGCDWWDRIRTPKDTKNYSGFMWLHVSGIEYDNDYCVFNSSDYTITPTFIVKKYSKTSLLIIFYWALLVIVICVAILTIKKKSTYAESDRVLNWSLASYFVGIICVFVLGVYELYSWAKHGIPNKELLLCTIGYVFIAAVTNLIIYSKKMLISNFSAFVLYAVYAAITILYFLFWTVGHNEYLKYLLCVPLPLILLLIVIHIIKNFKKPQKLQLNK